VSGYDPATGVYELTATNAREWFDDFFDRIARILAKQGLEVLFKTDSYLLVRATPAAIWTALTGKPGASKDQNVFFGARRYTATYLGHIVKPQQSAQVLNKLLDGAGLIYHDDDGEWLLTSAGKRYGEYVVAAGRGSEVGEMVRTVHWDLGVLDVLGLHWPKPAPSGSGH
jgi:hypothetical protein